MQMTRRLGGYHILATIGHGGMGDVYLAIKDGPGGFEKLLVLKVLQHNLIQDPEFLAMFLDEGRIAARLNHPNVVQTFETGRDDNSHFIVMEYLNGVTLGQLMQTLLASPGPDVTHLFLTILSQALNGLHHAHELTDYNGLPLHIVHRDATPQNIFVTFDGAVKVVDFGIAKALDSTSDTRVGAFKGKLGYLPPEQIMSNAVDRRADIFSMGVILHEILTGHRMYQGRTEIEILSSLSKGILPTAESLPASLPDALQWIVARATAADRTQRYATAREFEDDITDYLAENGGALSSRDIAQAVREPFNAWHEQIAHCIEQQLKLYNDYQHGMLNGRTPTAWQMIPRLTMTSQISMAPTADNSSQMTFEASAFADEATVDYRIPGPLTQSSGIPPKKMRIALPAVAVFLIILSASGWWAIQHSDFFDRLLADDTSALFPGEGNHSSHSASLNIGHSARHSISGKPLVEISGDIEDDTVLTNDREYLLKYNTYVHAGASLIIQKGTVLKGDVETAGTLVIHSGARIIAEGAPDAPIVFTSSNPVDKRRAGDWGGIVILGQAPVNNLVSKRPVAIKGLISGNARYGGDNPDDDSGILAYVRIEYAGKETVPGSEANSLTLAGVGRFTKFHHIQVRHMKDDCYRFLGGTVDGKFLICQSAGDDGFDWDYGYTGRLQFLLLTGHGQSAGGSNGLEGDNNPRGSSQEPISSPVIYNATLCGQHTPRIRNHFGILARRASLGEIGNSIITGFSAGLDFQGEKSRVKVIATTFHDNMLNNVAYPERKDQRGVFSDDDGGFSEYKWINQKSRKNSYEDPGIPGCIRRVGVNYKPEKPIVGGVIPPDDGFFDTTATYRGAFRNEADNWDQGKWVQWQ